MSAETPSPLFIELEATAQEDLHTGTGTGSGDVDALVQRDRTGRPVIRASHLKGLLREAGEELIALTADKNAEAQKTKDLNRLFGTKGAGRAALSLASLRVSEGGGSLVWGASARKAGSRAPEGDTLRYVEYVAAGTKFKASLRLADPGLKPLLETLLRRVDRIGGDRNRGGGLIELNWSDSAAVKDSHPEVQKSRLRLVLRNLEPLCLPATGHPGNLIRGQSFIRGQTLRGALMAWAIRAGRTDCLDLFRRLAIGDALPLPEGAKTAATVLPIPLSILTPKPKGGDPTRPWWAAGATDPAADDSLYREKKEGEEKPKRPGAHEYLCQEPHGGPWLRYSPAMSVRLRNATPKRGAGGEANLFSLEEIAEDTRFQAELRFDDPKDVPVFIDAFAPVIGGDWLAVGRGGMPVVVELLSHEIAKGGGTNQDDWTLTLTSDLIVRGPNLGFLDNLDISTLCKLAGMDTSAGGDWKIRQGVAETERLHGFNAVTGLRRTSALALRRGSCWRISGLGSAALAQALAAKGALGERTSEGMGQYVIGTEPFADLTRPKGSAASPTPNANEALLARAKKLSGEIGEKGPSLSQLQWLRERALATTKLRQLDELLEEIAAAPTRRRQGGKPWEAFPVKNLQAALKQLEQSDKAQELRDKQQLISYLVQWRAPKAKDQRR